MIADHKMDCLLKYEVRPAFVTVSVVIVPDVVLM